MIKHFIFIVSIFFSSLSIAQQCHRPQEPAITGSSYRDLQENAANAAFLADECGFDNEVSKRYQIMIKLVFDESFDQQQIAIDEFRRYKQGFIDDSNFFSNKKSCLIDTGRTKSFISDVVDDLIAFSDLVENSKKSYREKMEEWNFCLARQRAEEAADAYARSEEYARKKAVEDIHVGFRVSLMESGTYVLQLKNVSNQTADFQLQCYQTNGNYKTFNIALTAGGFKEIGYMEGWPGNFISGEYCRAMYKGEYLWRVTR